jgi:hypothetical protein
MADDSSYVYKSADGILMIFEGGDYTVRPADPELLAQSKRRREKEAELRKLMEDYYKEHPEKRPPTNDDENQPPMEFAD